MKHGIALAIVAVVVLAVQLSTHGAEPTDVGPFETTSECPMNYRVPQWYDDAKFGVYFHLAPFSAPAYWSEWCPKA